MIPTKLANLRARSQMESMCRYFALKIRIWDVSGYTSGPKQLRAEQSRAEQSRAEQSRAEHEERRKQL